MSSCVLLSVRSESRKNLFKPISQFKHSNRKQSGGPLIDRKGKMEKAMGGGVKAREKTNQR